ncbi:hypothetical protein ERJ75_001741900 [Trypanosoma vivax]|uniref:BRCT domain-containing protein n=1 Tax=Trypanosoma vivax (strain Y486) TaxID=1055687 RepID=G0U2U8_TRYVY|nr:hypothetical protein TRVL_01944 [Trypanosoma vivax]KAH8604356.1 hypothetical protein ERJ75_001741900 [Trypanosoma vivax]CCC50602.1 conserved hypothetical protein [Trypanosoma vivax Y486]
MAATDSLDLLQAASSWTCPSCTLEVPREVGSCQMCNYARPMDRRGVPQIFTGFRMHFNGIIPRSLKHPSHSVEWRMAERHGATCAADLDLNSVNMLVYRPGYERSEKVRKCVDGHSNIVVVPVTWMLDCLLQSRQINPSTYALTAIPVVSQPTVRGPDLPHYQHPYFFMNVMEYSLSSVFAEEVGKGKASDPMQRAAAASVGMEMPPDVRIQEAQYTNVRVFDAVCNIISGKGTDKAGEELFDEDREERSLKATIEILKCEQRNSRLNNGLFRGMNFLLAPTLEANASISKALTACGANVMTATPDTLTNLLRTSVTHVLYSDKDLQSPLVAKAAEVRKEIRGLTVANLSWAEDCLMMGEAIPAYGQYCIA